MFDERRDCFIADIIEVCRKHKVLLSADWDALDFLRRDELPAFTEQSGETLNFIVDLPDLEEAIRNDLWDDLKLGNQQ